MPPDERGRVLRPGHTQSSKLSVSDSDMAGALAQAQPENRARFNRLTKVQQLELLRCAFVLLDILARDGCSSPARTRSCLIETPIARWAHSRKNGVLLHGGSWPNHHKPCHRANHIGRKEGKPDDG
jgi:hypothetical protein